MVKYKPKHKDMPYGYIRYQVAGWGRIRLNSLLQKDQKLMNNEQTLSQCEWEREQEQTDIDDDNDRECDN